MVVALSLGRPLDLSLLITIGLIFLATSIGGYVRSRIRDRCLTSFEGFSITLEKMNGKVIYGKMRLAPTGMEFVYPDRGRIDGPIKTTSLLYAAEYK